MRALAVALCVVLLAACARNLPAPIADRSVNRGHPLETTRRVVAGDTLYSIAWEAGLDYHKLAAWNGISVPYTIEVGQEIHLQPRATVTRLPVIPRTHSAVLTPTPLPPAPLPPSAVQKSTSPATVASSPRKKPDDKPLPRKVWTWLWPADGALINYYPEGGATRGVDIVGNRGDAVQAAAAGRVVYQGSGLRGYGRLIIIKHTDELLSAYAHNDRVHVEEGDQVMRGQRIAEMGMSGTDRVKLHFEIRRNGRPVDPLQYLPRR